MINGMNIKDDMTAIRSDLGVCPQFDILWPEITVKEHLMLYAAIKGFTRQQQLEEATDAANNVGGLLRLNRCTFFIIVTDADKHCLHGCIYLKTSIRCWHV